MNECIDGVFKGWISGKPFGFIQVEDGLGDVIMYQSEVAEPQKMGPGTRVEFTAQPTEKGRKAVKVQVVSLASLENPRSGKIKFWDEEKNYGFITPYDGSSDVHISAHALPRDEYLSDGFEVEFLTRDEQKGPEAYELKVVKWLGGSNDSLTNFADMGKSDWPDELAEMAEHEPGLWDYKFIKSKQKSSKPILRSYFRYTFQRLEETEGIIYSSNDKYAAFNTGLVTPTQLEIYALFQRHDREMRQPWKFSGFHKISDRPFVVHFGSSPPPLANYFDDPSVLLFDRRLELNIDFEHIMANIERFPEKLQADPYVAQQLLDSAIKNTRKRVYRNYKAAIPQFFRDKGRQNGSVQLLLPICLTDPAKADIALVAERIGAKGEESYICRTILTLDMAYNNARLLARPDTEWLQP